MVSSTIPLWAENASSLKNGRTHGFPSFYHIFIKKSSVLLILLPPASGKMSDSSSSGK